MTLFDSATLVVNEMFGPTIQGEGPSTGKPCVFLRLAGCNLSCTWCDTPYTWDYTRFDKKAEAHKTTLDDVRNTLKALWQVPGRPRLIISGGEPLLQQKALIPLVRHLTMHRWLIEIETAGTIKPEHPLPLLLDQINVSPKLASSGNKKSRRYRPEVINWFARRKHKVNFKFVVQTNEDWDEMLDLVEKHDIWPGSVYVMPEGTTEDDQLIRGRMLVNRVIEHGFNLTLRAHTLLWGSTRAV